MAKTVVHDLLKHLVAADILEKLDEFLLSILYRSYIKPYSQ